MQDNPKTCKFFNQTNKIHMKHLHAKFNEVIVSYKLDPFTEQEFSSITEMFHNMTEHDIINLAHDYAKELIVFDYESMYV